MRIEEEFPDVLQNIESSIMLTYQGNPELSDYDVMETVEALIDSYIAEKIGRKRRKFPYSDVEYLLFNRMRNICEWRLGRSPLNDEQVEEESICVEPISVDVMLLCLKRVLKSVHKWNKYGGRQGYLQYVSQFF